MARTVRDAAILLEAMAGEDSADPATGAIASRMADFTSGLAADGLRGKHIGVMRSYYGAGFPATETMLEKSIGVLESAGAEVIDNIEIQADEMYAASNTVLLYEFKTDLEKYLRESGAPVTTLNDIIRFNNANSDAVMPHFGQNTIIEAEAMGTLDDPEYLEALETSKRLSSSALEAVLAEHSLDAIIAPTNGPAWFTDHLNGDNFGVSSSSLAAISGFPNVTPCQPDSKPACRSDYHSSATTTKTKHSSRSHTLSSRHRTHDGPQGIDVQGNSNRHSAVHPGIRGYRDLAGAVAKYRLEQQSLDQGLPYQRRQQRCRRAVYRNARRR